MADLSGGNGANIAWRPLFRPGVPPRRDPKTLFFNCFGANMQIMTLFSRKANVFSQSEEKKFRALRVGLLSIIL